MTPNAPLFSLACADVLSRVERKKSVGLETSMLVALIPTAVKSAIDLAVTAGGPGVQALIDAAKPEIRQFVSNNALKFLEATLAGLEDVRAGEGEIAKADSTPTA